MKSGPRHEKGYQKKCTYCTTMVWVYGPKTKAVCPNWSCQLADTLDKTAIHNEYQRRKKERLRNECNSAKGSETLQ